MTSEFRRAVAQSEEHVSIEDALLFKRDKKGRFTKENVGHHPTSEFKVGQHVSTETEFKKGEHHNQEGELAFKNGQIGVETRFQLGHIAWNRLSLASLPLAHDNRGIGAPG